MKNLLTKWLNNSGPNVLNRNHTSEKLICERQKFIELINMERSRVHRTNKQFSLILFSFNGNKEKNRQITEIIKIASNRLRLIDQIGWYDDSSIGLLLPNTDYKGAETIANEICQKYGTVDESVAYKTFCYPNNGYDFGG